MHDTGHDIDGLLRARRDHDLLGFAPYRAGGPEIVANGPAQLEHAVRIAITKVIPPKGPQRARTELTPQLGGARIHQRAPQIERTFVAVRRHIDETAKVTRKLTRGGRGFRDRYRRCCGFLRP